VTAMLQAIQTSYAGHLFRSRLEARWAVFFDALKIRWEYEPEGFRQPSGRYYLPEFRLMVMTDGTYKPLWAEIKPIGGDQSTLGELIAECEPGTRGVMLHDIPDPRRVAKGNDYYDYDGLHRWERFREGNGWPRSGCDNYYQFCICPSCGKAGFEFEGRSARIGCGCCDGDRSHTGDDPRIVAAFAAARSARFEHEARETFSTAGGRST